MRNDNAPASLARVDVIPWTVSSGGYVGRQATMAAAAASDAYDWMAARAGQLNPQQRDAQQAACAAYVKQMAAAGSGELGTAVKSAMASPDGCQPDLASPQLIDGKPVVGLGLILGWILASLVSNIVSWLFWHLVDEPPRLSAFQAMHTPE
jgi:hypothetical protein